MTSYKNAPMHCLNEVIGQQLSNIASQHQQKKEKQFPPSDAIKTFGGGALRESRNAGTDRKYHDSPSRSPKAEKKRKERRMNEFVVLGIAAPSTSGV